MARARLHLICGNCGCNDEWEWEHQKNGVDLDGINFADNVTLTCKNCSTNHSLFDYAKQKGEPWRCCEGYPKNCTCN